MFMTAAMNSTITAISIPFAVAICVPWGWTWLWPLVMFIKGKRFTFGYNLRKERAYKVNGNVYNFNARRLVVMVKVVAFYLCLALFPYKMGFFRKFGDCYIRRDAKEIKKIESMNGMFFGSVCVCLLFFILGMFINPFATLLFFIGIGAFSQFKFLGQFVAERYLYIPAISVCVIAGSILTDYPVILSAVVTALSYRTLQYIPMWENMEKLYANDVKMEPKFNMAWSNHAQYLLTDRSVEHINTAYVELLRAEKLGPECFEVYANLAVCFINMQQFKLALNYTEKAIPLAKGKVNDVVWSTLLKQRDFLNRKVNGGTVQYGPGTDKITKTCV
jgi:hypothetical protein